MPIEPDDPDAIRHLIPRLAHVHHEYIRVKFAEMRLYRGQGSVLRQLWKQDGQTPTELCQTRKISPSTMTRTLQRMEKEGWIVRSRDPDDQRVVRVHLTEAGREAEQEVDDVNRRLEEHTLSTMTPQERAILRRLLIQAVANIEDLLG